MFQFLLWLLTFCLPLGQIYMGNTSLNDMTLLPGVEPMADVAATSSPGMETKAKKKPMKSLYLKFFETAPDGNSRICRLCRKSYCMTTATGKWS
jgi:hypothetical protein